MSNNKWSPYSPGKVEPTRISRGKLDLFIECPRCFYLDRRLGIKRPGLPGWSLNTAVDNLLKHEFDGYRAKKEIHPLMKKYNIDAIPFSHEDLPIWRDDICQYVGASYVHKPTNLEICGIVDDIWVRPNGELIIADYKATSTKKEFSLEDEYKQGYKKQAETYQWIFRQNGFTVSETAYFVFANGIKDKDIFDGILEFEMSILEHKGDDSWVEDTIYEIKKCLESDTLPECNPECEHCAFRDKVNKVASVNPKYISV